MRDSVDSTWKQISNGKQLILIAGPCVIESEELCAEVALSLGKACRKLGITYIFKASYDKANRTSGKSFRGPGIEDGLEVLASIPRIEPYIVAGAKEGESFKNLGRSWIVARAYGGLEDVRLHDLRHSYASLAASRGVSLPIIGKLLGHRVAATTQRYAHLARDVVADINDQLGAAMTAAIEKPPAGGNVVKMKRKRRARG